MDTSSGTNDSGSSAACAPERTGRLARWASGTFSGTILDERIGRDVTDRRVDDQWHRPACFLDSRHGPDAQDRARQQPIGTVVNSFASGSVRLTLRVLDELGLEVPALSTSVSDIEHAVLAKARELASSFPSNLVRIQGIRDDHVYRFTHGRWRAVVWRDTQSGVLWVCACELRGDDTYDEIIERHRRGELLPDEQDDVRLAEEAALLLGRELVAAVPRWVRGARDQAGAEQRFSLSTGAELRMLVQRDGDIEALWLAMPTLVADVPGLSPNARAIVVALAERELGDDAAWETRHDWPTGALRHWEVARLGIGSR